MKLINFLDAALDNKANLLIFGGNHSHIHIPHGHEEVEDDE